MFLFSCCKWDGLGGVFETCYYLAVQWGEARIFECDGDPRTPGLQDTRTPGPQGTRTPCPQDSWSPGSQDPTTPGPRLPQLQPPAAQALAVTVLAAQMKTAQARVVFFLLLVTFELPKRPCPFGESKGATHRMVRLYFWNMLQPSCLKCYGLSQISLH